MIFGKESFLSKDTHLETSASINSSPCDVHGGSWGCSTFVVGLIVSSAFWLALVVSVTVKEHLAARSVRQSASELLVTSSLLAEHSRALVFASRSLRSTRENLDALGYCPATSSKFDTK